MSLKYHPRVHAASYELVGPFQLDFLRWYLDHPIWLFLTGFGSGLLLAAFAYHHSEKRGNQRAAEWAILIFSVSVLTGGVGGVVIFLLNYHFVIREVESSTKMGK